MSRSKPTPGQLDLDYRDRDQLISELCLPESVTLPKGGSVRKKHLRAVLYRLDRYLGQKAETYVGQETVARQIDVHIKTVERAITALKQLGLVSVKLKKNKDGIVCNHYTVNWRRMRELSTPQQHPELNGDTSRPIESTSDSELTGQPQQGDTRRSLEAASTSGASHPSDRSTDPTFEQTDPTFEQTDPTFEQSDPTSDVGQHREHNQHKKNIMAREPVFESGTSPPAANGDLEICSGERKSRQPHLRGIRVEELADAKSIEIRWKAAVAAGYVPQTDFWKLTFFGLCHSIWRRRNQLRSPPGMLVSKLKSGTDAILQQVADDPDRAWAKRVLRSVSGEIPQEKQVPTVDPEAMQLAEQERNRRDQQRRLAQEFGL